MAERFTRKDFWDGAGKAGLVLGAIPIVYMLIEQLLLQPAGEKMASLPLSIITFVLWGAKFAGCILLMRWFMQRFVGRFNGVTQRAASRYGSAIALTSALIYAAFVLAWSKYIDPDMFSRAFEAAAEQYSAFMDSNTLAAMEQLSDRMPVIAFFSNFIWCFLYGSILSSILSRHVGADDTPFGSDNPFNQDNA